ncbi:hypothetical protein LCGC14_0369930 [marine sediment metagenome]|uniref:Uncharacterized protein n=1 Tax=marine sediment metagenome TaxID=412755 RepID=A0A0F9TBD2_9ZZZZ
MMDKQELNKFIARWMWPNSVMIYVHVDCEWMCLEEKGKLMKCFTHSLDACGVLMDRLDGYLLERETKRHKTFAFVELGCSSGDAKHKEPAMAFCLALKEMIEGEKWGAVSL